MQGYSMKEMMKQIDKKLENELIYQKKSDHKAK